MSLSVDKAQLASLFVEAILYGLYTFLFCCTIYVLIYKRTTRRPHYGMLFATLILFVLATSHLVTNFIRLVEAFTGSLARIQPGAAVIVLENTKSFTSVFKATVLFTEILVGDVVLTYRCYVAWAGRIRIIILPLALLLGTVATALGVIYHLATAPDGKGMFTINGIRPFITSTQTLVLLNNVICTGLLAWRLWSMSRTMVSRAQRHSLRSVAIIIVESGLMTTLTWLLFIIVYALRSKGMFIVLDALAPITGGAFCLIVSRVALGVDNEATSPTREAVHLRGDEPSASVLPVLDGTGRPHRPMEISVSSRQSVRVETELDAMDKKAFAALALL